MAHRPPFPNFIGPYPRRLFQQIRGVGLVVAGYGSGGVIRSGRARQGAHRISVLGDSYTGGSKEGGRGDANWLASVTAKFEADGTKVVAFRMGLGGAGYVKRGSWGKVFGDVIRRVFSNKTDLAVIFGSINDGGIPIPHLAAAARSAAEAVRICAPAADLMIIGPAWMDSNVPERIEVVRNCLSATAVSHGAMFVDPLAEGWFFDAEYMGTDGVHPTDEGHAYIAEMVYPHFAAILERRGQHNGKGRG